MEISIEYCVTCNYRPMAAGLAMAIERAVNIKPSLMPSHDAGAFEVKVGGELIFSKKKTGFFPGHAEIIEALKALL